MPDPAKNKLLFAALSESLKNEIIQLFSNYDLKEFKAAAEFEESFDSIKEGDYDVFVCSDEFGSAFSNEFAQILRQQCPSSKIIFVTSKKESFQPTLYVKNGFNSAFLWPADKSTIREELFSYLDPANKEKRSYKPVYAVDIEANSKLPFSTYVYLPLNNKTVRFTKATDQVTAEKMNKLKSKDIGSILVDKKEMGSFQKYSAERLKALGSNDTLSQTEKSEKIKSSVRNIFSSLMDQSAASNFETGKETLANCQKLVSSYITGGKKDNWYSDLVKATGSGVGSYDHAASVSSIAALFAIGLQHPKPEDLAIAGFFHDIGRFDFDEDLLLKPENTWPADVLEKYKAHPTASVNSLKEKKIILSPEVEKAILQHHEKYDGKGFPKALSGDRISLEAQILSVADQFFYLSIPQPGQKRLTPKEIVEAIRKTGSIGPGILKQIESLVTTK